MARMGKSGEVQEVLPARAQDESRAPAPHSLVACASDRQLSQVLQAPV